MSSTSGPRDGDLTLGIIARIGPGFQGAWSNYTTKRVNGAECLRLVISHDSFGMCQRKLRAWWRTLAESANSSGFLKDCLSDEQWLSHYDHPSFSKIKQGLVCSYLQSHMRIITFILTDMCLAIGGYIPVHWGPLPKTLQIHYNGRLESPVESEP